jgi:L-ascorbate metabolism protein UlaG (beta-lactamase superfamily)
VSASSKPGTILERLPAVGQGLGVCWMGNAGWLVFGEGRLVAFDPDLESTSLLRKPPVSTEELAPALDAVFVTHEHGDHFNDATCAILAKRSGCVFVVPASCLDKARSLGIPEKRLVVARPRHPFDLLALRVTPTHAFHGHIGQVVYRDANFDDCGYVVRIAGRTVFHPGDSVLTEDQLALKGVDVLFISPTDHNMRVEPAARLIGALRPGWILPQHFDTYTVTKDNAFWTVGFPDELRAALPDELRGRYHKLAPGEVFVIPGA